MLVLLFESAERYPEILLLSVRVCHRTICSCFSFLFGSSSVWFLVLAVILTCLRPFHVRYLHTCRFLVSGDDLVTIFIVISVTELHVCVCSKQHLFVDHFFHSFEVRSNGLCKRREPSRSPACASKAYFARAMVKARPKSGRMPITVLRFVHDQLAWWCSVGRDGKGGR